ncbi:MAG TPA: phosphoserine phosphatase SerB [Burkholderiaceae bacterium]|nr:phosphoserine phosphatase SerB [Burkholderiaceae bacterium]
MDLVIQSSDLPSDAVQAFKVACVARRVRRRLNAARLADIQDDADTRKAAAALGRYWKCDFAFVPPALTLDAFRLLALDMDSTLITIESLDELAALAGRGAEVAALTAAAMRGEAADYQANLRKRVALLEGVDASLLERVYEEKLQLAPGAERLIATCRAAGLHVLLATSGLDFFALRLKARLELDSIWCNRLAIADGRLTGEVVGPEGADIVDAEGKASALRAACTALGCPTARAIAIGDGANDLKMLGLAGISVAYRAKPIVQKQAAQALNYTPLDGVLEWFAAAQ